MLLSCIIKAYIQLGYQRYLILLIFKSLWNANYNTQHILINVTNKREKKQPQVPIFQATTKILTPESLISWECTVYLKISSLLLTIA